MGYKPQIRHPHCKNCNIEIRHPSIAACSNCHNMLLDKAMEKETLKVEKESEKESVDEEPKEVLTNNEIKNLIQLVGKTVKMSDIHFDLDKRIRVKLLGKLKELPWIN